MLSAKLGSALNKSKKEKTSNNSTANDDISDNSYLEDYCVKCKKRKMKNSQETTMKNGRTVVKEIYSEINVKFLELQK